VTHTHTPGPWQLEEPHEPTPNMAWVWGSTPGKDTCICNVLVTQDPEWGVSPDEALANACLIASAPDLLAACEAIAARLEEAGHLSYGLRTMTYHEDSDVMVQLRAAISKAKGESDA